MIKLHYGMWAVMAACLIVLGMLYRGQQDMLATQKFNEGAAMVLRQIPLKQLADISI